MSYHRWRLSVHERLHQTDGQQSSQTVNRNRKLDNQHDINTYLALITVTPQVLYNSYKLIAFLYC